VISLPYHNNIPPIKKSKDLPNLNFSEITEQAVSKFFGISKPGFGGRQ
jgi:hypothetical protein